MRWSKLARDAKRRPLDHELVACYKHRRGSLDHELVAYYKHRRRPPDRIWLIVRLKLVLLHGWNPDALPPALSPFRFCFTFGFGFGFQEGSTWEEKLQGRPMWDNATLLQPCVKHGASGAAGDTQNKEILQVV